MSLCSSRRRCVGPTLALVVGLVPVFVPSAPPLVPSGRQHIPLIRYVANAGVMVAMEEAKVLIDAPIRDGIPPYATSSAEERARLEGALDPYDRVDAILVTHWHEDHFSPDAVAAHLTRNARAVLVSSPEVVQRVRTVAPHLGADRLQAVLPAPGASEVVRVGQLAVRVLRIRHNPTRRLPEQHVGFLVGETPSVLHVGDADPQPENFALLQELSRVDLALVPYWFLTGDANRRLVSRSIAPRQVMAMHVPPAEAETVTRELARAKVSATLLAMPGTTVR